MDNAARTCNGNVMSRFILSLALTIVSVAKAFNSDGLIRLICVAMAFI